MLEGGPKRNGRKLANYRVRWSQLSRFWSQHSLLSRILLVLAMLATAGVAAIIGLVIYFFIGGYSGGSDPTNIAPVLFPVAILLFLFAGLPAMLVCVLLWLGYARSSRTPSAGRTPQAGLGPEIPPEVGTDRRTAGNSAGADTGG
jgi:hypothetical protein